MGIGLTIAGCGSSESPAPEALLFAVNGARQPVVFAGDTAVWGGFGFGTEPGPGVLVSVAGGLAQAQILSWSEGAIQAVLPTDVASGPTYVLTATDSLGPLDLVVRPRTTFDPAAHGWVEDAALPEPLASAAAAAVRFPEPTGVASLVVLTGGRQGDGRLSDSTYLGFVSDAGRITEWRVAPDTVVPVARQYHAMAGADRTTAPLDIEAVAYMLGGVDSAGRVLADVLGISVSPAGAYGLWTGLASLPDRRGGTASITAFGKVYAVGGFGSDSLASRGVAYATIRPDGTLNGWFLGPPLPEGRAFASVAIAGTTLFAIGGERGLVHYDVVTDTTQLTGTVFAIRLSPLSGSFRDTAWTELPTMLLAPRSRAAAFLVEDALVVTGGVYADMPSSGETEFARFAGDTLEAFQQFPGAPLAPQAGGATWSAAAPILWTRTGVGRSTVVGGNQPTGPTTRTWSQ
jgi:hypothetical protein